MATPPMEKAEIAARQETAPQETAPQEAGAEAETMEMFRKSFFYGSRGDLLFKFMKNLSDADAAEFLRGLLEKVGETIDDGGVERLLDHVYQWNIEGYLHEREDHWQYDEGPFTPLEKPLAECRVGLLTASGHFVEGDDPEPFGVKNMTQAEAVGRVMEFGRIEAPLCAIPIDTPPEKLRLRHPGYDTRGVGQDHNAALPIDRLRELAGEGVIGELLPDAFSFVGLTAQTPLKKKLAPQWAEMLKARGVDAMLLVPV